jgi:tetratricopeptide (TPR) repeat protein
MFQATWGLYINAARTQRLDKAKLRGEQLLDISEKIGDEDLKLEALHHRWGYAYFTGQNAELIELSTEGVRRYDRDRHHRLSFVFASHDPGVCAHCALAFGLAVVGRAKSARRTLDAGLELSHSLQHPLTLAFFYAISFTSMFVAGDADRCREFAEGLAQAATKYEFPLVGGVSTFMLGAARALQKEPAAALREMEPSFEAAVAYGFFGAYPGVIMVSTLAEAGRNEEALKMVSRLIDSATTPQTGAFVSELWRLRGELLLRQSAGHATEAEHCLRVAERIAREQGAVIFHLKAGTSLAALLADGGRREEARAILDLAMTHPLDEWTGPEPARAAQLRSTLT